MRERRSVWELSCELLLIRVQLAWVIAFVSSILSAVRPDPKERVPPFAWWTLVYMLFSIVGVSVTVASDSERTYHVAVGRHALLLSLM